MRYITLAICCVLLSACDHAPDKTLNLAAQGVYTGSMDAAGEFVLIGSIRHGGSLWRTSDGERLYNWNHKAGEFTDFVGVGLAGNGMLGITADQRRIVPWRVDNGKPGGFWNTPADIRTLALSGDARHALIGLKSSTALFINSRSGEILKELNHQGSVTAAALDYAGRIAITGSDDGQARLWSTPTGSTLATWPFQSTINRTAITKDGHRVFISSQRDRWSVLDTQSKEALIQQEERSITWSAARFINNDQWLALGSTRRTIEIWDIETASQLHQWQVPARSKWKPSGSSIYDIAYNEASQELGVVTSDGRWLSWNLGKSN